MTLSDKAIIDLRNTLKASYGTNIDVELSDEEINLIGELLLTALSEGLKLKVNKSTLFSSEKSCGERKTTG